MYGRYPWEYHGVIAAAINGDRNRRRYASLLRRLPAHLKREARQRMYWIGYPVKARDAQAVQS